MIDELVDTRCAHSVPASEACRYELRGQGYFVCRACCGYCTAGADPRLEEIAVAAASERAAEAASHAMVAAGAAPRHGV